jgi:glutaredoxin 2
MPLYRELTIEELKHFEQEFKEFLAVNGIDSELWIEIKKTDNNKVNELIAAFSDVIYNSVLMKMEYVEFATENDIKYFHYEKDQAELIGLESNSVSFLDNDTVLKAIEEKKASIKAYRTIKKYTQTRETELFTMIKNGCQPSDGKMFKVLEKLV